MGLVSGHRAQLARLKKTNSIFICRGHTLPQRGSPKCRPTHQQRLLLNLLARLWSVLWILIKGGAGGVRVRMVMRVMLVRVGVVLVV